MRLFRCSPSPSTVLLVLIVLLLSACKKDNNPTAPGDIQNIYVAGNVSDSISTTPVYWKNGNMVVLPQPPGALYTMATCIVVSGSDIYVGGVAYDSTYTHRAMYWKNGNIQFLTDASVYADVYCAAVSGQDIYFAGYQKTFDRRIDITTYWKNRHPVYLTDSTNINDQHMATCIAISGQDVYVAAQTNGYWKNDQFINLGEGAIRSVAVSGSDVYLGGSYSADSYNALATYWKNSKRTILEQPKGVTDQRSNILSMAISGSNVYAGGWGYTAAPQLAARYWVNGKPADINNNSFAVEITGLAASGADVYISGHRFNPITFVETAAYWKNGKVVDLSDGNFNSEARGIFLSKY